MSDIFSKYVLGLGPDGEPRDLSDYEEVCAALRPLLVSEMRKRGLWRSPPRYVGVTAHSWSEPGAIDELVSDAYVFNFIDRLRGLRAQAQIRDRLQPMIRLNLKNFLTERQREADPLGYRVFGRLREAVVNCLLRGRLHRKAPEDRRPRSGDALPKVNNETLLTFVGGLVELARRLLLEGPVARWTDDLLPELVLAQSRAVPKVVTRLSNHVETLPSDGIEAFKFGDLATTLKNAVRARWFAIWRDTFSLASADGDPEASEIVVQDAEVETELQWLCRQTLAIEGVEEAIEQVVEQKRQEEALALWTYLRMTRLEPTEDQSSGDAGVDTPLPTATALAEILDVSRKKIPDLIEGLREAVETALRCAGSSGPSVPHRIASVDGR